MSDPETPGPSPQPSLRDARPIRVAPEGDERPIPPGWLDHAPVTRTLLAINVTVFVVEVLGGDHQGLSRAFSAGHLLKLGASYARATIAENRWETLVTACFLHGGLLHLGVNMLALWQAGPLVERAVGSARMAPMYLVAGAFGNLLGVAWGWAGDRSSVGASGAISGVIAAALVVGWRVQGWHGPLTQAMARWLGFVLAFGVLANLGGGNIDNAAHIGGALAGAVIASLWKRGQHYSAAASRAILAACVAGLLVCVGVLGWHDYSDPFASMMLQDRFEFTREAVEEGRCRDARDGLLAVERLRGRVASLRTRVEAVCGSGVDM